MKDFWLGKLEELEIDDISKIINFLKNDASRVEVEEDRKEEKENVINEIISRTEKPFQDQVINFYNTLKKTLLTFPSNFEDFYGGSLRDFKRGRGCGFEILPILPELSKQRRKIVITIYLSAVFDITYLVKSCFNEPFEESPNPNFESIKDISIREFRNNEMRKIKKFLTKGVII